MLLYLLILSVIVVRILLRETTTYDKCKEVVMNKLKFYLYGNKK